MALRMANPWKHPKTGVYYFRKRVPSDLVAVLGKSEHKVSLRTKDPATAKALFAEKWTEFEKLEKFARAVPEPLPFKTIVGLAGEAYRHLIRLTDTEPGETIFWDVALERIDREASSGNLEGWYGPTADEILTKHGLKADGDSRERLLSEIHKAVRQGAEVARRKSEGDYSEDPKAGRFPEVTKDRGSAATGPTIISLFELWKRRHLNLGRAISTPDDHLQKVERFIEYLGHDRARDVTPKNIADFCDHLQFEEGIGARTVSGKYLSALKAIFREGRRSFVIDVSPAHGIVVDVPKERRERPKGFTDEEAVQILSAALRAETADNRSTVLNKIACRWIPWLCAYTGARAGEMAQLRREDLIDRCGIATLVITPEDGTVKTDEYRQVPVHPHLIEQGFLEFVKSRPTGPLFYVPNNNPRKAKSTQAGNVRGKIGTWVRKTVGITDTRVAPNHGWRHRFRTLAMDVDIAHEYIDGILGHADGRAKSDYGEQTMKALDREIKKIPRAVVE